MSVHHHKINTKDSGSIFLIDGGNKKSALAGATGIGKATKFSSGASQRVGSVTATDFQMNGISFSIGGWVYRDSIAPTEAFGGVWGGSQQNYNLQSVGSTLYWSVRNGSGGFAQPNIPVAFSAGVWHFIVGVFDLGGSLAKVSIDGSAFTSVACVGVAFTGNFATGGFILGSQAGTRFMNGREDAWFVYKGKALDLAEVQALHNGGTGVDLDDLSAAQKTSLFAWYRMNETGLLEDRINAHNVNPQNYDLTAFNSPSFDVGKVADASSTFVKDLVKGSRGFIPTNAIGAINGVFPFNGVDEWIDCSVIVSEIDSHTVGSVEAWIRTNDLSASQYFFSVSYNLDSITEFYVTFGLNASGQLRYVANTDDGAIDTDYTTVSALPNTTDFHHVVITQDGAAPKIYVNGQEESLNVVVAGVKWFADILPDGGSSPNTSVISGLLIGGGSTPAALWDGDIRSCRYYGSVMTEAEIQKNYLSQKSR